MYGGHRNLGSHQVRLSPASENSLSDVLAELFRCNTVEQSTVPALLPPRSFSVPREIRGYRCIPVIPITVLLS